MTDNPTTDRRVARFKPIRTDDVRPEMRAFIGKSAEWHYAGHSDDDESYPGQSRWITAPGEGPPFWVPNEDLQDE